MAQGFKEMQNNYCYRIKKDYRIWGGILSQQKKKIKKENKGKSLTAYKWKHAAKGHHINREKDVNIAKQTWGEAG